MKGYLDIIIKIFGKTLLFLSMGIIVAITSLMLFLDAAEWLWPEYYGSYNLGSGIYMIEWDGGGKLIIKGSSIKGNTCYGGEYIIPTSENYCDSNGNFAEYVVDAKHNDSWIIAKTDNYITHQAKYYIINKNEETKRLNAEEIFEKYTLCFTDSIEFSNTCQNKGININPHFYLHNSK